MNTESTKTAVLAGENRKAFALAKEHESARSYYNLGTLYLQNRSVGSAYAALEKAYRIDPTDPDTLYNYELARKAALKQYGAAIIDDQASSTLEALGSLPHANQISGGLGILSLLTVLFWLRIYVRTRNFRHLILRPVGVLGFIVLALLIVHRAGVSLARLHPLAVSIEKVNLHSGPGLDFQELGFFEPGQKVRVLKTEHSEDASWASVRVAPDRIGWAPWNSLLRL